MKGRPIDRIFSDGTARMSRSQYSLISCAPNSMAAAEARPMSRLTKTARRRIRRMERRVPRPASSAIRRVTPVDMPEVAKVEAST